jgi:hypothetical protein
MKAALIQRQIKLNEQVLTGLHEEYNALRNQRAEYNKMADDFDIHSFKAEGDDEVNKAIEFRKQECLYREQAAIFTPYIRKFKKKIAGLEEIQRALKDELKAEQAIEAWCSGVDVDWQNLVKLAQQDDYQVTYSYDQLAEMFGED